MKKLVGVRVVAGFCLLVISASFRYARERAHADAAAKAAVEAFATARKQAEVRFAAMTPAEHLASIDKLRKQAPDSADLGRHAAAIPDSAPERALAVRILADLAADQAKARAALALKKARDDAENKRAGAAAAAERKRAAETAAIDANPLSVVKSTWKTGGFGSIGIWEVTFKNRSKKPVGNIKFRTAYTSETGNVVSRGGVDGLLGKSVIEKVIPPEGTRTVEVNDGFISGEAHKASFEIAGWEFVKDGR